MRRVPGMVMVGSAGRNAGKTTFACGLIERLCRRGPVVALKVTSVSRSDGVCPRGGEGCGVCTSFDGPYLITEETDPPPGKDTARLRDAGAERVYWLRVRREHLEEGFAALAAAAGEGAPMVCESNTLRHIVEPDLFLMVKNRATAQFKASAESVLAYVDRVVDFDGTGLDFDFDDVGLFEGRWALREAATAVVMAGGKSVRMGRDKRMLPVGGRPMIQRVCDQLEPHFQEVLVSADDAEALAFLGHEIVPDQTPGLGPLGGIASTLEAARHDVAMVVACDIPEIDNAYLRRVLRGVHGHDAAVPKTFGGRLEPLFAAYRTSILEVVRGALDDGRRRVTDVLDQCRVNYVPFDDVTWLKNINTTEDYEDLGTD